MESPLDCGSIVIIAIPKKQKLIDKILWYSIKLELPLKENLNNFLGSYSFIRVRTSIIHLKTTKQPTMIKENAKILNVGSFANPSTIRIFKKKLKDAIPKEKDTTEINLGMPKKSRKEKICRPK